MPILRTLFLFLFVALFARADDNAPNLSQDQMKELLASLHYQTGTITLNNGLAKITLADGFRYLASDDARKVYHQLWNNPDDPDLLGLIFPKDSGPADPGGYAIGLSYDESGYVKDSDADSINYNDLLKQLQQAVQDNNPERVKEGYPAMDLLGWAQPPRYDKDTHKLYWAKEFSVSGETVHALNYDIRILGRKGTLVLTILGDMSVLPQINSDIPSILAMVDFQPGNTYAEFDPKIDKVAEYGLAGLIFGGGIAAAAKLGLFAGLFKWIIALGVASWKIILIAVAAIGAGLKNMWGSITGKRKTPNNLLPPNNGGPPQA